MPRMAYLAYPIDQVIDNRFYEDVDRAKHRLLDAGVDIVFDPGDAFSVRPDATVGPEVAAINSAAASTATSLFAFLPKSQGSVGVPIEIDRAVRDGKWVAICSDVNGWMLNYQAPNVARFGLSHDDVDAAATWLGSRVPQYDGAVEPDPLPVMTHGGGLRQLPSKAHDDDAGFDLYVSDSVVIGPGSFVDIPCGVAIELPEWSFGWITGRSSALRKRGLLVHTGIIDAGYRGPLFAGAWNMTNEPVVVNVGERVAQLLIMPNLSRDLKPVFVEELSPSKRGSNGFGSSGA